MLEGVSHIIYIDGPTLETGAAQFSISNTGRLSYAAGSVVPHNKRTLVWVNRTGREEPLVEVEPRSYASVRFSLEGGHVLLSTKQPSSDVWLYDLQRHITSRQTFEGNNHLAIWGPGPDQFTFSSDREGPEGLYVKGVDTGQDPGEKLQTAFDNYQSAGAWSPDGKQLAFLRSDPETGLDIWILPLEGKPEAFLKTGFPERFQEFSPDGRWLAYSSDESGRRQV